MRTVSIAVAATTLAAATAFQGSTPQSVSRVGTTTLYEYIPTGFTKESWGKFKAAEQKKKDELAKKNLGRVGPKGFQSRSFQSFQEALERGETTHLLPVENAQERIRKGELKPEDIPVSNGGGVWRYDYWHHLFGISLKMLKTSQLMVCAWKISSSDRNINCKTVHATWWQLGQQ